MCVVMTESFLYERLAHFLFQYYSGNVEFSSATEVQEELFFFQSFLLFPPFFFFCELYATWTGEEAAKTINFCFIM